MSRRLKASIWDRTIATFSSDITRAVSVVATPGCNSPFSKGRRRHR
jgi:hypothetical protein